jgi:catechol 2,3-dioxygenase-like lactoylglutathione lyase family enzyme
MNITGIDAVTFGVRSLPKARRFMADWGMQQVRAGKFGADYVCVDGGEVKIRSHDNKRLPPPIQAGSTVREVIWGVKNKRDLKAIAKELSRDRRVTINKDSSISSVDDMGLGIGFRVSKCKVLKPDPLPFNLPGKNVRIDQPATFHERARPQAISHIVFGVPDFRTVESFYGDRLGFRTTDRYRERGIFLRATSPSNHHNLFVMNTGGRKPKFNHLAFKVRDIHEVIGGGQFLVRQGWQSQVGPGRHYVSSGCFWYFHSPFGGAMEYCADEDVMTDKWKPREFEVGPEIFTEWTFNAETTFKAPTAASRAK